MFSYVFGGIISNQDIKFWPIFFLAVSYFLRYAYFFERFFGFWILFLQIIFADKKLCKFKQNMSASVDYVCTAIIVYITAFHLKVFNIA